MPPVKRTVLLLEIAQMHKLILSCLSLALRAMDFAMPGFDPDQDDVDTVRCRLARSQSRLLPFLTVADICRLATVSYQHLLDTRVGIDEPGHLDRLFPEVQPQHAAGWHSPNQRGRRREEDEGQEDDEAEDGSMKRGNCRTNKPRLTSGLAL
mmetsp:Transcript_157403/g.501709  ORF Transcript_157403/g.501709 Transcript_157403/m.501709 type:complete len:152 (-) Transcript_157403:91-546(-)